MTGESFRTSQKAPVRATLLALLANCALLSPPVALALEPDKQAAAAQVSEEEAPVATTSKGQAPAAANRKGTSPVRDTWFVATIASGRSGAIVTHFWSKGRLFRAESVLAGRRIVTVVDQKYYYTLDPVAGKGVRIERSARAIADDKGGGRPFAREWERIQASGAEVVRSETLGGHEVDVYQSTDSFGRRRVWLSRENKQRVLRIESFDRRSQSNSVVDYSGWMRGLEIASSFFAPASNIELNKLSYADYQADPSQAQVFAASVRYPSLLHGHRGN